MVFRTLLNEEIFAKRCKLVYITQYTKPSPEPQRNIVFRKGKQRNNVSETEIVDGKPTVLPLQCSHGRSNRKTFEETSEISNISAHNASTFAQDLKHPPKLVTSSMPSISLLLVSNNPFQTSRKPSESMRTNSDSVAPTSFRQVCNQVFRTCAFLRVQECKNNYHFTVLDSLKNYSKCSSLPNLPRPHQRIPKRNVLVMPLYTDLH